MSLAQYQSTILSRLSPILPTIHFSESFLTLIMHFCVTILVLKVEEIALVLLDDVCASASICLEVCLLLLNMVEILILNRRIAISLRVCATLRRVLRLSALIDLGPPLASLLAGHSFARLHP